MGAAVVVVVKAWWIADGERLLGFGGIVDSLGEVMSCNVPDGDQ